MDTSKWPQVLRTVAAWLKQAAANGRFQAAGFAVLGAGALLFLLAGPLGGMGNPKYAPDRKLALRVLGIVVFTFGVFLAFRLISV